jgi:hypothetical protein
MDDLLERYFFSDIYPSSCSVILQKFHNNTIEHYSIVDDKQTKDNELENAGRSANKIVNDKSVDTILSNSLPYRYTNGDINNFFASDNGQEGEHTLENSICRPLIGIQNYKPFFKYCKEDHTLVSIIKNWRII